MYSFFYPCSPAPGLTPKSGADAVLAQEDWLKIESEVYTYRRSAPLSLRNFWPHSTVTMVDQSQSHADAGDVDPMANTLSRSRIAQTLREARASLANPSRPFTPADRSLFQRGDELGASRPSSG